MPAAAQLPLSALSKQVPGPVGPEPLTSEPPLLPTAVPPLIGGATRADAVLDAPLYADAVPLTSEPPLADATPLTSEPPLTVATPLTSERTAPGVAGAMESPGV